MFVYLKYVHATKMGKKNETFTAWHLLHSGHIFSKKLQDMLSYQDVHFEM